MAGIFFVYCPLRYEIIFAYAVAYDAKAMTATGARNFKLKDCLRQELFYLPKNNLIPWFMATFFHG